MYKFADSRIRRTWTPISEREYKDEKDEWRKKKTTKMKINIKQKKKNKNGTFFIEQQKYRSR